jgi:hypothetical protein
LQFLPDFGRDRKSEGIDMGTVYIPVIQPQDYAAFRRLLSGYLPDTVDEWDRILSEKGLAAGHHGDLVQSVTVDPAEFARYLHGARTARNLGALYRFANEKSAGKQY